MSTTLTNSTSQVDLAAYGTGNPFRIHSGVSIVNTHAGESAIYGDASQSWTLTNAGRIGGGDAGIVSGHTPGGGGGAGVDVAGALTLRNSGKITGGDGGSGYLGGPGASGVSMGGGRLTNMTGAMIAGGSGGYGSYDAGGVGGSGVSISGFATVVNQAGATILGGADGDGKNFSVSPAGAGIVLKAGGNVTDAGVIRGGDAFYSTTGTGSAGVLFQGSADSTLTLATRGTISGGEAKTGGKAVQFGDGNDRLVIYGYGVLLGGADGGGGNNTLELASSNASGTIASIGFTITNFQTVVVDANSTWSTPDIVLVNDDSTLTVAGRLAVADTVDLLEAQATVAATGRLTAENIFLTGDAALTMNDPFSSTGTLTEGSGSRIVIGTGSTLAVADGGQLAGATGGGGTLALQGGVTVISEGANCKVANLTLSDSAAVNVFANLAYVGKLTEGVGTKVSVRAGEMLTVNGTIAGFGAIDIGVGSTLKIAGAVGTRESIAFGDKTGKLTLLNPKRFRARITRFFAGDKIDIANANFAFGTGETLTFVEKKSRPEGTLTLKNGVNTVALHLFGQHIAQRFHISDDGHGGTLISYKPPAGSANGLDHLASSGHG